MIAVGFYLRGRIQSVTDFLVAGRKLGLALTTATMAAVRIGTGVILGGAELGAESGAWPGMWYGLGCAGGLVLAGVFVAPKLRAQSAYVPLDFFESRYGRSRAVRFWAWLSNIPSLLGIFVVQLMASGNVFTLFGLTYAQAESARASAGSGWRAGAESRRFRDDERSGSRDPEAPSRLERHPVAVVVTAEISGSVVSFCVRTPGARKILIGAVL